MRSPSTQKSRDTLPYPLAYGKRLLFYELKTVIHSHTIHVVTIKMAGGQNVLGTRL
jgi:hypothetical protein